MFLFISPEQNELYYYHFLNLIHFRVPLQSLEYLYLLRVVYPIDVGHYITPLVLDLIIFEFIRFIKLIVFDRVICVA